jgi:uncharacterized protein (TIGR03435 family)
VRIFTLIFMAVAGLTPVQAFAQKTDGGPTFEVAYKCRLDYLIEQAFDLQRFQIAGAPGWAHADRFNIEAKPPASAQSSQSNPNNPKLPPKPRPAANAAGPVGGSISLEVHHRKQRKVRCIYW